MNVHMPLPRAKDRLADVIKKAGVYFVYEVKVSHVTIDVL